ncbi:hypothetical protein EHO58_01715 [Leptospira selangorensis]|uniref:hypothetical protein n=1 Tax=Leptospira selangorensis TaxID=2484982 RepID=UPI00108485F4|nr:hypothetical protein [Leptospira selangorensis]TGK09128.1 hypothetical protein EHO58_01715 [Leptospira selangorensis]
MGRILGITSILLLILTFPLETILAVTIQMNAGRIFKKVSIQKESETEIEVVDPDGVIYRIRKDKIKQITEDAPDTIPEFASDESVPTGAVKTPSPKDSLPEHSILLSQSLSNDGAFQGSDLFGERQARRNGTSYKDFYEAYFLTTSVEILGLPKQFKLGLTVMNPLVDRSNTDSDLRLQSTPGGPDQTYLLDKSLATGILQFDPNEVKTRKEKNGLFDYVFTRAMYDHETRLGTFSAGFLFINQNDPSYVMRGYWVIGWKAPFWEWLNPQFSINNKMLNDYGGTFQGTHNYRLTLSHEFFKGETFRVTPSLVVGYAEVNDNTDRKKGISDISPRLQFDYGKFFFAANMMYRATPALVDNATYTPNIGAYPDSNANDGLTIDPAKAYGYKNELIVNYLSSLSDDPAVKRALVDHYQQQHIVHVIFFYNIGYTIRI